MREATLNVSGPLILITPIHADPMGVAIAAMVSVDNISIGG